MLHYLVDILWWVYLNEWGVSRDTLYLQFPSYICMAGRVKRGIQEVQVCANFTKLRGRTAQKCQKIGQFSSKKAFCMIFLVMRLGGYSNFVCVKRTKRTQWLIISRKILSHADLANLAEAHLLSLVLTSGWQAASLLRCSQFREICEICVKQ